MHRQGHLFNECTHFWTLHQAARRAWKGRQHHKGQQARAFMFHLEDKIYELQSQLQTQQWRASPLRHFIIHDPKLRLISASPFADRVVHHALSHVMMPRLEKFQIDHSYACRPKKGLHRAIKVAQNYARKMPYVLRLDIAHYFENIPHDLLMLQLHRLFKDPQLLALCEHIIRAYPEDSQICRGIPIGSLMSQHFANMYLGILDHKIKEQYHVQYYLRYMDDLVLFAQSKSELWEIYRALTQEVSHMGLQLKPTATLLSHTAVGFSFLGFRIWPHTIRFDAHRRRRWIRNIKKLYLAYQTCAVRDDQLRRRSESLHQWARVASSFHFRNSVWRKYRKSMAQVLDSDGLDQFY